MKKIAFLLGITLLPLLSQGQKLEGLKNALESGSSSNNNSGDSRGGNGGNYSIWADLFFNIVLEPTWWLLFRGPNEMSANAAGFNEYPYADEENSGLYLPLDMGDEKRMSLQLTGHAQSDEDAVFGGYLQAKWSPNRAFSLDVNHLQLFETLDEPVGGGTRTDHFAITNFNFGYNRVHHPKFQLWWGGGLMLLNPGKESLLYGSASLNAGLTWYIKRPLSIYADGVIGFPNGAYARQHQVRMQVHLERFMLYAGYQGTKIGTVSIPSAALGTGVWF